jgi:GTP-binding protein
MKWLLNNNIIFKIIFTKEDKLKLTQRYEKGDRYVDNISKRIKIFPEFIISSSKTKKGRDEILNFIHDNL